MHYLSRLSGKYRDIIITVKTPNTLYSFCYTPREIPSPEDGDLFEGRRFTLINRDVERQEQRGLEMTEKGGSVRRGLFFNGKTDLMTPKVLSKKYKI